MTDKSLNYKHLCRKTRPPVASIFKHLALRVRLGHDGLLRTGRRAACGTRPPAKLYALRLRPPSTAAASTQSVGSNHCAKGLVNVTAVVNLVTSLRVVGWRCILRTLARTLIIARYEAVRPRELVSRSAARLHRVHFGAWTASRGGRRRAPDRSSVGAADCRPPGGCSPPPSIRAFNM